jgi:hypothetical protein
MSDRPKLLFVYNADSGLFNTLADIGHKIFAPATYECALCALTHGYFKERGQWRAFIEGLACDCEFLHRDQYLERFPDQGYELPAVFRFREGHPECCIDAGTLRACGSIEALQALIEQRCCDGST